MVLFLLPCEDNTIEEYVISPFGIVDGSEAMLKNGTMGQCLPSESMFPSEEDPGTSVIPLEGVFEVSS